MAGGCPQSCVWWLDIRNSGGFVDGLSCRSVSTDALLLPRYLFVGTREFDRQVHLPRKPGNPIGFSFKFGTAPGGEPHLPLEQMTLRGRATAQGRSAYCPPWGEARQVRNQTRLVSRQGDAHSILI